MADPPTELPVETKWLKLGVAIAFLQALFVLLIVVLLAVDTTLALLAAVVLGTGGGIALVIYVQFYY